MQTTVDLQDSLYQKSKTLAASRGATVQEFIVEAVAKEVQAERASPSAGPERRKVQFDGMRIALNFCPGGTIPSISIASSWAICERLPDRNERRPAGRVPFGVVVHRSARRVGAWPFHRSQCRYSSKLHKLNIVASRLDSARCFSTTTPSPSPVPYGDFFSRWFGSTVRQFMRNPRAIWNCAPVMCKTPVPGIRTAWISPVADPRDPIPGRPEFFVSNSP